MKKVLKKYFIPHEDNGHKPHFLREKSVLSLSFIVAGLFLLSLVGNYAVKNNSHLAAIQAAFLVDLTNNDREDLGLPMLAINDRLINAAELKAQDMAEKSYFAHTSPEGVTPWYWIDQAGYSYVYAGENLAVNFYDSVDVQDAWMDSPTHRQNILSPNFNEIGIATSKGTYKGDRTTFVVQMFGSQKASVASASAQNNSAEEDLVALTQSEEVVEEEEFVLGSEIEKPAVAQEVVVKETTEEPVVESFVSTVNPEATPEDLQSVKQTTTEAKRYTSWVQRLMVSPTNVVESLYITLAVLVIFSLVLKIFIEIRKQHPRNIAYGVLLLVLIVAFMHLNRAAFTDPVLVVGLF